jgi:hypothetical protein
LRALLCHVGDKAHAFARDSADHSLSRAAVANRLACRVEAGGHGGFGDGPATPDAHDQIVLTDDTVAVVDEVNEEVEDLRFERDWLAVPAQLAALDIQHAIGKRKSH